MVFSLHFYCIFVVFSLRLCLHGNQLVPIPTWCWACTGVVFVVFNLRHVHLVFSLQQYPLGV